MANSKISELAAATALAGTEAIPAVQDGATVKTTPDQIRDVVKAVDATSTDGVILETSTAATVGAQKYSPRIRWKGFGWKTNATAASQAVEFAAEVQPVQGTAAPTGTWKLQAAINGGAYADVLRVGSDGVVGFNGITSYAGSGTFTMSFPNQQLNFTATGMITLNGSANTLNGTSTFGGNIVGGSATAIQLDHAGVAGARFGVDTTGNFKQGTANQSALNFKILTELTTVSASGTTDTTIQIPAGAIVLAVPVRVTTVIPTATSFSVGDATNATRFGTSASINVAAGTTDAGTAAGAYYNASASSIRLTMNGGTPAANSGRVRVTIYYLEATPPTS